MNKPTVVDIPHAIGRDAARERLRSRIGELAGHLPGGMAEVNSSWTSADRLVLEILAMGQRVTATLDVEDSFVRASFELPAMLSFMSGMISKAVRSKGAQLLLK